MGKPNPQNLIPFKKGEARTKEMARKAGTESGKSKRAKKSLQESLQGLMFQKLNPKMKKMYEKMGYKIPDKEDVTMMDMMGASCMMQAMKKGDFKAMEAISKMAGIHTEESKLIIEGDAGVQRTVVELSLGERPEGLGEDEPQPTEE